MSNENVKIIPGGLKCDNSKCDWADKSIKVKDLENWINSKCPKCNDNLLTLEDYNNAMIMIATAELFNEFKSNEILEMSKGQTIEDIKSHPMIKNAKGLEHLKDINERVIMSVNTHKGLNITEFKPID